MDTYTVRKYYNMTDATIDKNVLLAVTDNDDYDKQLIDLLLIRYRNKWIMYDDVIVKLYGQEQEHVMPDYVEEWLPEFTYVYKTTKDRYKTLLKYYDENKDHLMEKLSNSSTVKYNDTPSDSRDLTGNGFTSTVTTSKTESDPNTLSARLNEIYYKFRNLMDNWVFEFRKLYGNM